MKLLYPVLTTKKIKKLKNKNMLIIIAFIFIMIMVAFEWSIDQEDIDELENRFRKKQ